MTIDELLGGMRSGAPQPERAIEAFIEGVVDGSVSRPQAAAWLAWAYLRGLNPAETLALTRAMTRTGEVLAWGDGPLLIDKHSTGGVGDKVSLVLAPLWAELGLRVPMLSGRGLGHTGGTLDKLEAIPGFRTHLAVPELSAVLASVGAFISGQTTTLAPADRVLYGLRNETNTVDSIPLIVGSILSKKLAEGVQQLVLDVKTGSGAFMQTEPEAVALATALVHAARDAGLTCSARVTAMDRPLGRAVGNALEVVEACETLQGGGPSDLRAVTLALADHPRAEAVLDSGAAFARFERMVEAQGGDPGALRDPTQLHGGGVSAFTLVASRSGWIQGVHARRVGRAAFVLGAGRVRSEDPVDPGVGVVMQVAPGAAVSAGDPLATVYHRDGRALEAATQLLSEAVEIGPSEVEVSALVRDVLSADLTSPTPIG